MADYYVQEDNVQRREQLNVTMWLFTDFVAGPVAVVPVNLLDSIAKVCVQT